MFKETCENGKNVQFMKKKLAELTPDLKRSIAIGGWQILLFPKKHRKTILLHIMNFIHHQLT